jgi:hypothetical protein
MKRLHLAIDLAGFWTVKINTTTPEHQLKATMKYVTAVTMIVRHTSTKQNSIERKGHTLLGIPSL